MKNPVYTIRSRPHTYYAGTVPQGDQILMGWLGHSIVVFRFDGTGQLVEEVEHPIVAGQDAEKQYPSESVAAGRLQEIKQFLGFREGVIRVMPFFIEHLEAGIRQFPEDLEDFMSNPDAYTGEDVAIFRQDIEDWKGAGNCVLFWGNDYDIDGEGYTI